MLYFAYGSNMSAKRLLARVPSATFISVCKLDGYRMTFKKKGLDGSGKCTISATAALSDYVMGVVYDLNETEKETLDKIEGAGRQYFIKYVEVIKNDGSLLEVFAYIANESQTPIKPYHWYKHHVLIGAMENALPTDYIDQIRSVESVKDPDNERCEKEMAIYLNV